VFKSHQVFRWLKTTFDILDDIYFVYREKKLAMFLYAKEMLMKSCSRIAH